ncbi:MAG: glycerophosphodiester phosphodiesterase family protein [Kordiimonas sp.]
MRFYVLFFTVFSALGNLSFVDAAEEAVQPIVIGHRGASGYLPEHTLSAYSLAIEQGVDYIEPDLVMTKDGVLVARHDIYLSTTTDVASRPEFSNKKRIFEGKEDWFVFDFTYDELAELRAVQPWKSRSAEFDGAEGIPTLKDIAELVLQHNKDGREVGLYIELKRPDIFVDLKSGFTEYFLSELKTLDKRSIPLYFQCFDANFILDISSKTSIPLILLVGGKRDNVTGWFSPDVDFELFYSKVAGFGLNKALLINKDGTSSGVLERIKRTGLQTHVWTIRNDQVPSMFHTVQQELKLLYSMGVDGVFADFPDTAVQVRQSMDLIEKRPF